jgi:hypothetical protein
MISLTRFQALGQLEKRKGGYFYLTLTAEEVAQFPRQRDTRLRCVMDGKVAFSCGLNHLGDGNFFLIVASRHLKALGKELGDPVSFEVSEDPNPLGVEVPEVLEVLLAQDEQARATYESFSEGTKRSLIFSIQKMKNLDRQVAKIQSFLAGERPGRR